jgi:hypothetical protein
VDRDHHGGLIMADLTIDIPEALTITLERADVQAILSVLKRLPFESVAPLIVKFKEACEAGTASPTP